VAKALVMYSRTSSCPFVSVAKRVLDGGGIAYQEIYIDRDPEARQRVLDWTGFLSVPTIIVSEDGILPIEEPEPLPKGSSPRGIDRGAMITEPSIIQLKDWLTRHGFTGNGV
jgi:glutaredoxin